MFRKSDEKRAEEAAAQAEIDRLKALHVADMAELLLPALGPDGPGGGHTTRVQQLCEYLLRDYVRPRQLRAMQVSPRVYDGLGMLERAGLVSTISVQRSPLYKITPLGESVLADGTLRQHIMPGV